MNKVLLVKVPLHIYPFQGSEITEKRLEQLSLAKAWMKEHENRAKSRTCVRIQKSKSGETCNQWISFILLHHIYDEGSVCKGVMVNLFIQSVNPSSKNLMRNIYYEHMCVRFSLFIFQANEQTPDKMCSHFCTHFKINAIRTCLCAFHA